jgi:DNA-binding NarL/FixJ family response regulator
VLNTAKYLVTDIYHKMRHISTVIIDDERYACERLKRLLSSFNDIILTGYFTDSVSGVRHIIQSKPDLVFLDIELENNISAFDIINQLDDNNIHPYIILVTAFPQYSIKAIRNEVFDYLLKPVDIDELKSSIIRLGRHISPFEDIVGKDFKMLSERETEVLRLVLEGKSSTEIANLLYLSINTVHTHRRNILKKTGAKHVVDLLRTKAS